MEIVSTLLSMLDVFVKFLLFMGLILFIGIPVLVSIIEKYLKDPNDEEKDYFKSLYNESMEFMLNPRKGKHG